ncbi:MAG: RidA family protein [Clostridiales Family XIII bacterium]|nr:RidA family protein [Clostridiales Family XIII bacterium]
MINTISTDRAPAAIGPYSQAKAVGGFLFTSGQIPINPATGEIVGTEIKAQTEQVLKNIDALLQEAGASPDKVLKTLCFLADMDDFAAFNEVYAAYFTDKPARSAVGVKALPKGALVEIETIAYIGE